MQQSRKKKTFIGSFGGVALADILANGVVVLLVVIIITINQKRIQAEQETEQSVEISAILARDIASSLVFNDLPSSPPAVLHNYDCLSLRGPWRNEYERHDCQIWLYPIFELHNGYIRERNSGRIFARSELLQENNALDVYLSLLEPVAKQRARLDIYSVDLYYLGLSILREGGVEPSHWHFMGESLPLPPAGEDHLLSEHGEELTDTLVLDEEGQDAGEGDAQTESQLRGQGAGQDEISEEAIPEDASLREAELLEDLLPPPDAETLARGGSERGARVDSLSEFEEGGGYGDALAEELARAILNERGAGGDAFGETSSLSIRFPTEEGGESALSLNQVFGNALQNQGQPVDYHIFMIVFLSEYLRRVDERGIDDVDMNKMLMEFLSGGFGQANQEDLRFAEDLREEMRIAFQAGEGSLKIESRSCSFCLSRLLLRANDPLNYLTLLSMNAFQAEGQRTNLVNVEMRLFPYLDKGEITEIFRGDTVLVPRDILDTERWYPVAILDPNISDVVVGYVYGGNIVSGTGFGLLGDVNRIYLQEASLSTSLPSFSSRREFILGIIYGGAVFLILALLILLGWGAASRKMASI